MRIPNRSRGRLAPDNSMTPLIDVVFLLLIFFVCASIGQAPESLLPTELAPGEIEAPAAADPEKVTTRIWVHLQQPTDGPLSLRLQERQCANFGELSAGLTELAQLQPENPIVLDIGPNVEMEAWVDTWDVCNRAGFHSISFATRSGK